jgi:hypothetical protein
LKESSFQSLVEERAMKTGMLWFDNDLKADLATKIAHAADYYQRKYGQMPSICFVNPTMLNGGSSREMGIEVRPNRQVLPNHLWMGLQDLIPGAV